MKKILSIILASIMLVSLVACNNTSENETVSTSTATTTNAPEAVKTAESVVLGSKIATEFAELTIDEAGMKDDIQTSIKSGYITRTTGPSSSADTEFVYIRGKIKNLTKSEISMVNVGGLVDVDGYTYEIDFDMIEADGSSSYSIAPLVEYTYTMYAEVPNQLAESWQACSVNFGFEEAFESSSDNYSNAKYKYVYNLTK